MEAAPEAGAAALDAEALPPSIPGDCVSLLFFIMNT